MNSEAEKYYNDLKNKPEFSKLTNTGIDSHYDNVFKFAEEFCKSQEPFYINVTLKGILNWFNVYEDGSDPKVYDTYAKAQADVSKHRVLKETLLLKRFIEQPNAKYMQIKNKL